MDIAKMIIEIAKDMEKNEKTKNSITFQLKCFKTDIIDSTSCFHIRPKDENDEEIIISYKESSWVQKKSSKFIFKLVKVIFRQMLKDFMTEICSDDIYQVHMYLTISHKSVDLFTDHYFVDESICDYDVSMYNLHDSNENTMVLETEDMIIGYLELCLNMAL